MEDKIVVRGSSDQQTRLKEIDRHVGGVIRNRRRALGMSQGDLAAGAMVSFQQLQKQERGVNRVSASALYMFAKALRVGPGAFFEGLPDTVEDGQELGSLGLERLWATEGALEVLKAYQAMPPRLRKTTIALIKTLAEDEPDRCKPEASASK